MIAGMEFSTLAFFALTVLVASLSPGPNILIVMVHSLKYGWKYIVFTVMGNLSCLFLFGLLAAIGVGAIIQTTPVIYGAMKLAGGLYLAYMGYNMLISSFNQRGAKRGKMFHELGENSSRPPKPSVLYGEAFLTSASNPKSILFLTAVFPQFLNSDIAIAPQFIVMFVTLICVVAVVHGSYGLLAHYFRARLLGQNVQKYVSRIAGISFIGLGAGVAFSK